MNQKNFSKICSRFDVAKYNIPKDVLDSFLYAVYLEGYSDGWEEGKSWDSSDIKRKERVTA